MKRNNETFNSDNFAASFDSVIRASGFDVTRCVLTKCESLQRTNSGDARLVLVPVQGSLIVTIFSDAPERIVALMPFTAVELPKNTEYSLRASDIANVTFLIIESEGR
jgi:hypothetical protein